MANKVIIKDYPNYELYNDGRVLNIKSKRFLKIHLYEKHYPKIVLSKNNKPKTFSLHRLLAIHFIPNPNNLPCVNHINGDKHDYTLSNLEWVTHKDNTIHAVENGLFKDRYKQAVAVGKKVLNTETGIIYDSMSEAALSHCMNKYTLINKLKGNRKNDTKLKLI